ncbi:MAG: endonuclease/exonuclease/phosphatase family protein [Bacteroidales bacterium]|nr:endonuclease/exonuclease/phosphatase family protein [Bacteroidales bacterium]
MKKILKFILYIIIVVVIAFAVFLIYATIDDYKPDEKTTVFESDKPELLSDSSQISLMVWNIGYCGLNKEMDFFYDGGENVRPSEENVKKNLQGVKQFIQADENIDFILFQEVDKDAKRSYHYNQYDTIANMLPERNCTYGKNYDVFFVPQPITDPMGSVNSGLMTVSKYVPAGSIRYSFPGNYSWPLGLFFLDRCFLVNSYNLSNDKKLLIINTHNSAYDDGSLKEQQMEYLKTFLTEEYNKGNYIIVGGDWNQCPPGFKPNFKDNIMDNETRTNIDEDYLEDWHWLYDNKLPTNRRVATPYIKGKTLTTVIDFYLLSPNIEAVSVNNIDVGFEYSDHQPVKAVVKLK